jgi:hypothetical protein
MLHMDGAQMRIRGIYSLFTEARNQSCGSSKHALTARIVNLNWADAIGSAALCCSHTGTCHRTVGEKHKNKNV